MNVAEAANVNQIAVDEAIDALPDQDPPEVQVIPQYNMFSAGQVIAFTTPNIPVGRWVRDRYFTQDNFNFLLINELPFTILIYVNNMGCLDCHYNTQYLRCTFTRKMSEIYEKHGSWDFIKNGDFYIYEREQLEVSFKFVAISPDGLCILKDIGPFVQTCCYLRGRHATNGARLYFGMPACFSQALSFELGKKSIGHPYLPKLSWGYSK